MLWSCLLREENNDRHISRGDGHWFVLAAQEAVEHSHEHIARGDAFCFAPVSLVFAEPFSEHTARDAAH